MKIITKNFRLNALANQYAAAVHSHVIKQNGGEWFNVNAHSFPIRVNIVGGITGVRQLVDAYFLEALQLNYQGWEAAAIALFDKCLAKDKSLNHTGIEIWESMISDMGSTVAGDGNG